MASWSSRQTPRVMVDTTVLLAGTIWPRWPYAVLQHALHEDLLLVLAPVGITEAHRVFQARFPQHAKSFARFLDECRYESVPDPTAEQVNTHHDLVRDVNDIPLALAAILAQVDYFVSDDKDFTDQTPQNIQLHRQLRVLVPGTFLREIMGWSSEELESVRGRKWDEPNLSR